MSADGEGQRAHQAALDRRVEVPEAVLGHVRGDLGAEAAELHRLVRDQHGAMVVEAAIQEDVDIVGLSILSGAHVPLVTAVRDLFEQRKVAKPIFVGGIIPPDDAKLLKSKGIAAVFGPGASLASIVEEINKVLKA